MPEYLIVSETNSGIINIGNTQNFCIGELKVLEYLTNKYKNTQNKFLFCRIIKVLEHLRDKYRNTSKKFFITELKFS